MELNDGDIYIMSENAAGADCRKSSIQAAEPVHLIGTALMGRVHEAAEAAEEEGCYHHLSVDAAWADDGHDVVGGLCVEAEDYAGQDREADREHGSGQAAAVDMELA